MGALGRDLGARAPRSGDGEGARGLNRRWRRSIADIVRHGRETGEFPDGRDADDLGIQIGAVIDGLAIQVLMDHGDVTPDDMLRVSREVSAKLIGFALEPAGAQRASLPCAGHGARAPLMDVDTGVDDALALLYAVASRRSS